MHRSRYFFAIVSTIIEKKSARMLPEGNGSCFYIEKKGKQKETIIFFYIEKKTPAVSHHQ